MPFLLERLDDVWEHAPAYGGIRERVPHPPSSYIADRVFGCIFDDFAGLAQPRPGRDGPDHVRDRLPARRLDLAPLTARRPRKSCARRGLDDDEIWALVRGNAIAATGSTGTSASPRESSRLRRAARDVAEVGALQRRGVVEQLLCDPTQDDAAVVEDGGIVGDLECERDVLLDEQHCAAVVGGDATDGVEEGLDDAAARGPC